MSGLAIGVIASRHAELRITPLSTLSKREPCDVKQVAQPGVRAAQALHAVSVWRSAYPNQSEKAYKGIGEKTATTSIHF